MHLLYSLPTNLRVNEFHQHKCWRKVKFKAARTSNHGNWLFNLHMYLYPEHFVRWANAGRGTPSCHNGPIATPKHSLNFKYHLLRANLRPGTEEKRDVKKPASNCHLLVNIPQLARTDSLDALFIVDYSPRSNGDSPTGIEIL